MPSRLTFKHRILREVAALAGATSGLEQQMLALPEGGAVTATAEFVIIDGATGGAVRTTASDVRDYVLGIVGGAATIPNYKSICSCID